MRVRGPPDDRSCQEVCRSGDHGHHQVDLLVPAGTGDGLGQHCQLLGSDQHLQGPPPPPHIINSYSYKYITNEGFFYFWVKGPMVMRESNDFFEEYLAMPYTICLLNSIKTTGIRWIFYCQED